MPGAHTSESSHAETINELYWNSENTVDEIVETLGIGRNTLYSSVRPQPAGASCPDCGRPLVFTNRSNRSSGTATCQACGMETEVAEQIAGPEPGSRGADFARDGHAHAPEGGWSRWREDLVAVAPERAAMIGGAAALGMVMGAVAVRAVREMR